MSVCNTLCILFFFFSSRRRHTRYWRDWSSDVCSSDLRGTRRLVLLVAVVAVLAAAPAAWFLFLEPAPAEAPEEHVEETVERSEERRVEKECRSRWSPYH